MSLNPILKMDVDNPSVLKRSSSAPMINELTTMATSSTTTTVVRESTPLNIFSSCQPRTRRFSASSSPSRAPGASSPRLTPRVSQLRQEECVDVAGREAAHERELHSAIVMSQSWEDLTLVTSEPINSKASVMPSTLCEEGKRPLDPLHLSLPTCPPLCSTPSPTRTPAPLRSCFSPSYFTKSNLSPSPTRKAFATRRSLSPIAMRPSSLGSVKRKFDLDDNEPPAKRGGLLIQQSRLDVSGSPLPGSLSSVGTPDSVSSGDSPRGFPFNLAESPGPPQASAHSPEDHPMDDLSKHDS